MYKYYKYSILFVLISVLVFVSSCTKDLGNYDYKEINEVQISGIDTTYTALLGEPFAITPELNFTKSTNGDDSQYTYEWIAFNTDLGLLSDDIKKDLAITKNLDLESLTIPPGTYKVYYRVTDTQTEVQWSKSFMLVVSSSIQRGWIVLNDDQGKARLDMVSIIDTVYQPIHDVLDYTGSALKLEGEPLNVACYSYDPQFYGVYVNTTGNGTTKIDPLTFDWEDTYRLSYEMLTNVPTDFGADFVQPIRGGESFVYKDGDVYYYYRPFSIRYGVPINYIEGEEKPFKASPFIGTGYINILYDVDNQRFVRFLQRGSSSLEMPNHNRFDYNTGKDLVFMTQTPYNRGEVFAILKDPADAKLYLARIRSDRAIGQRYYDEIPEESAQLMSQATQFAISPDYGYIFYNVGGKIYEYDFNLKTSKLMIDKGSDQITVLQFEQYSPFSKDLIVASCDANGANGKMELYTVPPVNGDLELNLSFDGFAKIVSIAFKI
ncbi:PKD-like family lipoprotein [Joostella sp. CR20]|uniref:PKD-like family lipoprotein n=1 Tax=Joostella sp. CR20 TaxID=2804312 RepID=UPI00313B79DF